MNQPQTIIIQTQGQSTLGTVGLVLSCLGWLTCGLLCIPGAAFSFLGLFSKSKKGHALAGLIVGFPGTLLFAFFGAAVILPMVGLGGLLATGAASQAVQAARAQAQAQAQAAQQDSQQPGLTQSPESIESSESLLANLENASERPLYAALPDDGQPPIPDPIAKPEPKAAVPVDRNRTFTDVTGRHKIVAELLDYKKNWVKLRKEDGKEITMPITKLSAEDQEWVKANAK